MPRLSATARHPVAIVLNGRKVKKEIQPVKHKQVA